MLLKLVLALTFLVSCTLEGGSDARETHSWAVKLSEDSSPAILNAKADALARECGVVNLGTIGRMSTVFEFGMRAEENQSDLVDYLAVEKRLASHTAVQWVSIQRPLKRVGRSFRDPYFLKQWHLVRNVRLVRAQARISHIHTYTHYTHTRYTCYTHIHTHVTHTHTRYTHIHTHVTHTHTHTHAGTHYRHARTQRQCFVYHVVWALVICCTLHRSTPRNLAMTST